ncbi:MAG TPA: RNA 2',3'-cyclic phosphodiesterase [Terriglobales bacterium]
MRLFIALDINSDIRERIAAFRDEMRRLAPEVRWVGSDTFHVTLQFLGETKKLDEVQRTLQQVKSPPLQIAFRGAGFFPNPKAPRVFWVGITGDQHLQGLATKIGGVLSPHGFERDAGPYKPHLTLARSGSGRPKPILGERAAPGLQRVRAKLAALSVPDFGTMTAHEFCLYESKLTPTGPRYTKLARFPLSQPSVDVPLIS